MEARRIHIGKFYYVEWWTSKGTTGTGMPAVKMSVVGQAIERLPDGRYIFALTRLACIDGAFTPRSGYKPVTYKQTFKPVCIKREAELTELDPRQRSHAETNRIMEIDFGYQALGRDAFYPWGKGMYDGARGVPLTQALAESAEILNRLASNKTDLGLVRYDD